MEFLLIFWLGFAIVVGVAANTRGRNGIGWFFLAVLISPLTRGPFGFGLRTNTSRGKTMSPLPVRGVRA